jgi:hypothetical protein
MANTQSKNELLSYRELRYTAIALILEKRIFYWGAPGIQTEKAGDGTLPPPANG